MSVFSPLPPTETVILVDENGVKNTDQYCRHKVIPGLDGAFCEECRIWYADLAIIKAIKTRKSGFAESTRDTEVDKAKARGKSR